MNKYLRFLLWLLLAWWPMQVVHEAGHVLGCLFSGATVEAVVLWPWEFSRTIRHGSGAPLLDTWTGPVFGAGAPTLAWWNWRKGNFPGRGFLGFFAGFCLLANGLYLGVGWVHYIGDAGELRALGAPPWLLSGFGALTVTAGLGLWHRELFQSHGLGGGKWT